MAQSAKKKQSSSLTLITHVTNKVMQAKQESELAEQLKQWFFSEFAMNITNNHPNQDALLWENSTLCKVDKKYFTLKNYVLQYIQKYYQKIDVVDVSGEESKEYVTQLRKKEPEIELREKHLSDNEKYTRLLVFRIEIKALDYLKKYHDAWNTKNLEIQIDCTPLKT